MGYTPSRSKPVGKSPVKYLLYYIHIKNNVYNVFIYVYAGMLQASMDHYWRTAKTRKKKRIFPRQSQHKRHVIQQGAVCTLQRDRRWKVYIIVSTIAIYTVASYGTYNQIFFHTRGSNFGFRMSTFRIWILPSPLGTCMVVVNNV